MKLLNSDWFRRGHLFVNFWLSRAKLFRFGRSPEDLRWFQRWPEVFRRFTKIAIFFRRGGGGVKERGTYFKSYIRNFKHINLTFCKTVQEQMMFFISELKFHNLPWWNIDCHGRSLQHNDQFQSLWCAEDHLPLIAAQVSLKIKKKKDTMSKYSVSSLKLVKESLRLYKRGWSKRRIPRAPW